MQKQAKQKVEHLMPGIAGDGRLEQLGTSQTHKNACALTTHLYWVH